MDRWQTLQLSWSVHKQQRDAVEAMMMQLQVGLSNSVPAHSLLQLTSGDHWHSASCF